MRRPALVAVAALGWAACITSPFDPSQHELACDSEHGCSEGMCCEHGTCVVGRAGEGGACVSDLDAGPDAADADEAGTSCGPDTDPVLCPDLDLRYKQGVAPLGETCQREVAACVPWEACGDGRRQPWEECDPARRAEQPCNRFRQGWTGGVARCRPDCTIDASACVAPAAGAEEPPFEPEDGWLRPDETGLPFDSVCHDAGVRALYADAHEIGVRVELLYVSADGDGTDLQVLRDDLEAVNLVLAEVGVRLAELGATAVAAEEVDGADPEGWARGHLRRARQAARDRLPVLWAPIRPATLPSAAGLLVRADAPDEQRRAALVHAFGHWAGLADAHACPGGEPDVEELCGDWGDGLGPEQGALVRCVLRAEQRSVAFAVCAGEGQPAPETCNDADDDCDGATDERGGCRVPAEDDALEANDGWADAADGAAASSAELVVAAGDDDWFLLEVPVRSRLVVLSTFDHGLGDVDLHLLDAAGAEVDRSASGADLELVRAETGEEAEELRLRVRLHAGVRNTYRLSVVVRSLPCVDPDGDDWGRGCELGPDCDPQDGAVHPGAAEACNGVDDDCDEETDEGFGVGAACTVGEGACQVEGAAVCTAAGDGTECPVQAGDGGEESCNGVDDDCDGSADEDDDGATLVRDCYSAAGETLGVGPCHGGTETCGAGDWAGRCVGEVVPAGPPRQRPAVGAGQGLLPLGGRAPADRGRVGARRQGRGGPDLAVGGRPGADLRQRYCGLRRRERRRPRVRDGRHVARREQARRRLAGGPAGPGRQRVRVAGGLPPRRQRGGSGRRASLDGRLRGQRPRHARRQLRLSGEQPAGGGAGVRATGAPARSARRPLRPRLRRLGRRRVGHLPAGPSPRPGRPRRGL